MQIKILITIGMFRNNFIFPRGQGLQASDSFANTIPYLVTSFILKLFYEAINDRSSFVFSMFSNKCTGN